MPRREVTLLVEDAVVGEEDLVVHGLDLAPFYEGSRVEDVALFVDEADDHRDVPGGGRDGVESCDVVADEGRLEDQVLGRVAGDGQLWKAHHASALRPGALGPVDDQTGVAGQVADR